MKFLHAGLLAFGLIVATDVAAEDVLHVGEGLF
jgi:hypothetical protein